ncbi:MAG: aspartate aminotransferase family protein [Thiotrichales bacterium]|nr:aspartate aminotransferase family protein [Thiotrichales bacterium]
MKEFEHLFRYVGEFADTVVSSAHDNYMVDREGKRILDFSSGQMSAILGHAHPEIVATVRDAMSNCDHLHSSFIAEVVIDFAAALCGLLPGTLNKIIPLSTGAESNEAALRAAKLATGRFEVVAFDRSWHGVTGGASATTFNGARRGYGAPMPGVLSLPTPYAYRSPFVHDGVHDWQAELDWGFECVDRQSVGSLAAMIAEPILSSAGIVELPDGYLKALSAHCRVRDMVLILDEAQTGLGRTGHRFAFEHEGVVPDILTLSKTLGAGLPLSATITNASLEQTCFERGFLFYTTHTADPLPAAVGLKVIEILVRDSLHERAATLGSYFKGALLALQQRHEVIGDVRGRGLLLGLELVKDRQTKEPALDLGAQVGAYCLERGASLTIGRRGASHVFRLAPPLTVSKEEIDTVVTLLDEALTVCSESS